MLKSKIFIGMAAGIGIAIFAFYEMPEHVNPDDELNIYVTNKTAMKDFVNSNNHNKKKYECNSSNKSSWWKCSVTAIYLENNKVTEDDNLAKHLEKNNTIFKITVHKSFAFSNENDETIQEINTPVKIKPISTSKGKMPQETKLVALFSANKKVVIGKSYFFIAKSNEPKNNWSLCTINTSSCIKPTIYELKTSSYKKQNSDLEFNLFKQKLTVATKIEANRYYLIKIDRKIQLNEQNELIVKNVSTENNIFDEITTAFVDDATIASSNIFMFKNIEKSETAVKQE